MTVRHALVEASNADAIAIDADRAVIEDSIVFNATGDGVRHMGGDGVVARNLTLVGVGGAALRSVGNATAQNVIANGAMGFVADAPWAAASHNISTDGTAPGQNSQTNVAVESLFVSLTPGAEDLHLAPMSPALNAGTDTGVVSWDIDLETRSGTWDIGADEQ